MTGIPLMCVHAAGLHCFWANREVVHLGPSARIRAAPHRRTKTCWTLPPCNMRPGSGPGWDIGGKRERSPGQQRAARRDRHVWPTNTIKYYYCMRLAASFCGDCQARSKALDSGSSHEGVRGFESHSPHLISNNA